MEPVRANAPATGPSEAKAGVLSLPDIFSTDSGSIQQDAEALGKLGYAVVAVDAADGDYKTPGNKGGM